MSSPNSQISGASASNGAQTLRARKGLWIAIVVVIGWLAIGGVSGPVFSKISTVQENDNSAFLPESAESTVASKITVKFSDQSADSATYAHSLFRGT